MDQIEAIVREVLTRLKGGGNPPPACDTLIPAEMSARHVHLSQEDLRELFGLDKLECVRNISQPGQFLSGCRVRLIGPKGILDNVAVLGPTRRRGGYHAAGWQQAHHPQSGHRGPPAPAYDARGCGGLRRE